MSDSAPKRVPETQSVPSGGPPKPPKKTAIGLEQDPSGDPRHTDVSERLLQELSRRMESQGLSVADRAKFKTSIEQLKRQIGKDT